METWEVIRTKRAVRDYDDRPLPERVLHRILNAGRLAGSARNAQPWRFIVVREASQRQRLSRCGRFARHLAHAPCVIVICTDVQHRRWAAFDAGRAAQNMVLAAWDQGVGSCVTALHDEASAREVLRIPDTFDIQVAIAFGYPSPAGEGPIHRFIRERVLRVTGRRPLHELVYYEVWGQTSHHEG